MPCPRLVSSALALLLPLLGCSKTEDVAPEKKIFGEPPVIETVNMEVNPQASFSCNWTEILQNRLCTSTHVGDIEATSPILISGTYTRLLLTARVTDPNTTLNTDGSINRTDLLLVSGSFTEVDAETPKREITLVAFDDGSEAEFPRGQRTAGTGYICTTNRPNPDGICTCQQQTYQLTSDDMTKNDSLFTRAFGFVGQGSISLAEDCLMESEEVSYAFSPPDNNFEFQIDAIDRSGNLATWGDRPIVTTGQDTFACTGDECGCCLLESSNPAMECYGLEGMNGTFHTCQGVRCQGECSVEKSGGPDSFYRSGVCKEIRNYDCDCFEPCKPGHASCSRDCGFYCSECF